MEEFVKRVKAKFPDDPSAPSVLFSWLGSQWYMSVLRYHEPYGEAKEVVARARGESFATCLQELVYEFDLY